MAINKDKLNYADFAIADAIEKGVGYKEDPTEFTWQAFLNALMNLPQHLADMVRWLINEIPESDPNE
jgi:hypothetical protein